MVRRLLAVAVLSLCACSNLVVVRGSSNDYLKRRATTVIITQPAAEVMPVLDELMLSRGFRPSGSQPGAKQSQIVIYRGSRPVPPNIAPYGIQLGSWFAARIGPNE